MYSLNIKSIFKYIFLIMLVLKLYIDLLHYYIIIMNILNTNKISNLVINAINL